MKKIFAIFSLFLILFSFTVSVFAATTSYLNLVIYNDCDFSISYAVNGSTTYHSISSGNHSNTIRSASYIEIVNFGNDTYLYILTDCPLNTFSFIFLNVIDTFTYDDFYVFYVKTTETIFRITSISSSCSILRFSLDSPISKPLSSNISFGDSISNMDLSDKDYFSPIYFDTVNNSAISCKLDIYISDVLTDSIFVSADEYFVFYPDVDTIYYFEFTFYYWEYDPGSYPDDLKPYIQFHNDLFSHIYSFVPDLFSNTYLNFTIFIIGILSILFMIFIITFMIKKFTRGC